MNNEEKILLMLEALTGKVDNIESEMTDIKGDITTMKSDMNEVKERLTNVEDKVVMTNVRIENGVIPGIQILIEGHQGIVEKLWHVPEEIEDIKE